MARAARSARYSGKECPEARLAVREIQVVPRAFVLMRGEGFFVLILGKAGLRYALAGPGQENHGIGNL